jgi:hypothetical protein
MIRFDQECGGWRDFFFNKLMNLVSFEVFTAVTMTNGVFWDVTPCDSCKNRRFGEIYRLIHQGGISSQRTSVGSYS